MNLLYEDAPNPYHSLDADGNIRAVNQKWLNILGYKKEEVIGHWFGDIIMPQSLTKFKNNFIKFKAEGKISGVELQLRHKDTSVISILIHGQIAYDANHKILHTHCSFENISDRRKLEHLNTISKLIRDIHQAIIRIKNQDLLLQESCNILISSDLYHYASIEMIQEQPNKCYHSYKNNNIYIKEIHLL